MQQQPKWVDINGNEKEAPIYVSSLQEALEYYTNIYDERQTQTLPETIGLPQDILSNRRACLMLSAASERASKRTKQQLFDETNNRKNKQCTIL